MKQTIAGLLLVISSSVSNVGAAVIFNNGSPDALNGYGSDFSFPSQKADNFVLQPGASTIGSVQWWGDYGPSNSPQTDNFTLRFYTDTGTGFPSMTPFLSLNIGAIGRTITAQKVGSLDIYSYSYTLTTPLALLPNTQYWFSPVNDTTADTNDNWFWATSSQSGNGATRGTDAFPWGRINNGIVPAPELAFVLSSPVPEPGSLLLMVAALISAVTLGRVRRSRTA